MCAYSVISEYYTDTGRWLVDPISTMDGETVRLLKEVVDRLDKIDARLKDVECHDPKKRVFKRKLAKRIRETKG